MHIHSTQGHPEDRWKQTNKKNYKTTSVSRSILWLSDCSNRKEMTGSDMHLPPSYNTSLLFLSPTLLSFQRQAAHGPRRTHEAAAERCHLPDTGDNRSQPCGYIGSHADAQTSPCPSIGAPSALRLRYGPTATLDWRQKAPLVKLQIQPLVFRLNRAQASPLPI